jgi:hypothetical protein
VLEISRLGRRAARGNCALARENCLLRGEIARLRGGGGYARFIQIFYNFSFSICANFALSALTMAALLAIEPDVHIYVSFAMSVYDII